MRRFFTWLVRPPERTHSWLQAIRWWEVRRIPYNIIVGVLGVVSLVLFYLFIDLAHGLKPGEDAVEPLVIILAPVLINVLYTSGWIAELFLRIVWKEESPVVGPVLLKLGLSLSLLVIFFPSTLWFLIWILHSS